MSHTAKRAPAASETRDAETLALAINSVAADLAELRAAINSLGVLDMTEVKLSAVQVDINDVILSTRSATDHILETAEDLIGTKQTGSDYRTLVEERMLALMEACSFQDLTGQRLQRVAHTLNAIEERLKAFTLTAKIEDGGGEHGATERKRATWNKTNLLSGPDSANGLAQDTVDRLMATTN